MLFRSENKRTLRHVRVRKYIKTMRMLRHVRARKYVKNNAYVMSFYNRTFLHVRVRKYIKKTRMLRHFYRTFFILTFPPSIIF